METNVGFRMTDLWEPRRDDWVCQGEVPAELGQEFRPNFFPIEQSGKSQEVVGIVGKLGKRTGASHARSMLTQKDRIPTELRGKTLVFPEHWYYTDGDNCVPTLIWAKPMVGEGPEDWQFYMDDFGFSAGDVLVLC